MTEVKIMSELERQNSLEIWKRFSKLDRAELIDMILNLEQSIKKVTK